MLNNLSNHQLVDPRVRKKNLECCFPTLKKAWLYCKGKAFKKNWPNTMVSEQNRHTAEASGIYHDTFLVDGVCTEDCYLLSAKPPFTCLPNLLHKSDSLCIRKVSSASACLRFRIWEPRKRLRRFVTQPQAQQCNNETDTWHFARVWNGVHQEMQG